MQEIYPVERILALQVRQMLKVLTGQATDTRKRADGHMLGIVKVFGGNNTSLHVSACQFFGLWAACQDAVLVKGLAEKILHLGGCLGDFLEGDDRGLEPEQGFLAERPQAARFGLELVVKIPADH